MAVEGPAVTATAALDGPELGAPGGLVDVGPAGEAVGGEGLLGDGADQGARGGGHRPVRGVGTDGTTGGTGAKTLPIWTAAKDLAGEQISKLQSALRETRHPLFMRIADQGLNAVTKRLQVGLQVALMELDGAAADARPKAAAKVQTALADFRKFLQTDPAVPLLEKNPMGIAVTLRAGLSSALDSIEKTLA